MAKYPAQIDNDITLPKAIDNKTPIRAKEYNSLRDSIISIQNTLGVNPSGVYASLRSRLQALETTVGNLEIIKLDGDIGGTLYKPTVIAIQNNPVSEEMPSFGEILAWNGIAWAPKSAGAEVMLNGDVVGDANNNLVNYIQGISAPNPDDIDELDLISVNYEGGAYVDVPILSSPNNMLNDGLYLYIAQSSKRKDPPLLSAKIFKFEVDGKYLKSSSYIDLSLNEYSKGVKSFAQDSTYLYVVFGTYADIGAASALNSVCIINKSTMEISGWGYLGVDIKAYLVCADEGIFYTYGENEEGDYFIHKFITNDCLNVDLPGASAALSTDIADTATSMSFQNNLIYLTGAGSYILLSMNDQLETILETNDIGSGVSSLTNCVFLEDTIWASSANLIFTINPATFIATNSIEIAADNPEDIISILYGQNKNNIVDKNIFALLDTYLGVIDTYDSSLSEYDLSNLIDKDQRYNTSLKLSGFTIINDYVYMCGYLNSRYNNNGFIKWFDINTQTHGLLDGYETVANVKKLKYNPIKGDIFGPINKNTVNALNGVQSPIIQDVLENIVPSGLVPSLEEVENFLDSPKALYHDNNNKNLFIVNSNSGFLHILNDETLQVIKSIKLNSLNKTPDNFTWEISENKSGGIYYPNHIIYDDTYLYVGSTLVDIDLESQDLYSNYYNNIAIISKDKLEVVGVINLSTGSATKASPFDFCPDNKGNLWASATAIDPAIIDYNNLRKYNVENAISSYPETYATTSISINIEKVHAIIYHDNYLWASGDVLSLYKINDNGQIIDSLIETSPILNFQYQKQFKIINNDIWFSSYDKVVGFFDLEQYPENTCIHTDTILVVDTVYTNGICSDDTNELVIFGNDGYNKAYVYNFGLNYNSTLTQLNLSNNLDPATLPDIGSCGEVISYNINDKSILIFTLPSYLGINVFIYDTSEDDFILNKTYFSPKVLNYVKNGARSVAIKNLNDSPGSNYLIGNFSYITLESPQTLSLPKNASIGHVLEIKDIGNGTPFTLAVEAASGTIDGNNNIVFSTPYTYVRVVKTTSTNWSVSGVYIPAA